MKYLGSQSDPKDIATKEMSVPAGGTEGMVLAKSSDSDYDVEWIDIDRTPVSISVTTPPTKTTYEQTESFDPTGMVVTLVFSDGKTRNLPNNTLTFSPEMFVNTGVQNVTISATQSGFTMTTAQSVTVTKVVITSWEQAIAIGQSGHANVMMEVGDQLNGTYKIGDNTYTCPWDVVGFRNVVALVNNEEVVFENAPVIQMHYLATEYVAYDMPENTVATETTAQSGVYYFGYNGSSYTNLNLSAGASIPYGSYTAVYKTPYNSDSAIRYGNSEWQYSWMRQYMNHSGTGWAQAQTPYDVLPSGASSTVGLMTYLDADLVNNIHPTKVTSAKPSYAGGGVSYTFDKFFVLSVSEMNMKHAAASADEGEPLDYYKELLNSSSKVNTGKYPALIKYFVNATSSKTNVRLRSPVTTSYQTWCVLNDGDVINYSAGANIMAIAPACVLV